MKKVLISGFTTFHTHSENSSQIIAEMLRDTKLEGLDIRVVILPVAYNSAFEELKKEIDLFNPDSVVCLGLAGNREKIEVEKVAINLIHSSIPDNDGVLTQDQPVVEGGPAAYFSTLPVKEMTGFKCPFPVEVSFSAGAYVCNFLMYQVLHYVKDSRTRAGFIHLPHLRDNRSEVYTSISRMIQLLK